MPASKERVRVSGVREVTRALKALEASTEDLKAVHTAVARGLLPGVAIRTPRRSGSLAASWSASATKTRARVTSPLVYAGPIEWGWPAHGIDPARMVRATIEAEQREIIAAYEHELEQLAAHVGLEVRP